MYSYLQRGGNVSEQANVALYMLKGNVQYTRAKFRNVTKDPNSGTVKECN